MPPAPYLTRLLLSGLRDKHEPAGEADGHHAHDGHTVSHYVCTALWFSINRTWLTVISVMTELGGQ